jgi:hypothetical protein
MGLCSNNCPTHKGGVSFSHTHTKHKEKLKLKLKTQKILGKKEN